MEWVEAFRATSIGHLEGEYLPRIERALEVLPADALWWSPHPDATSVGVLLRHLEGNVRQWILGGLGGEAGQRERAAEFAGAPNAAASELRDRLAATVREAAKVIGSLDGERLLAPVRIQGFDTTGLAAVYHVVEHFSWHTGQIAWIAKARAGEGHGLAYYDEDAINSPPPE